MSWNESLRYQLNVANDAVKSAYICQLEIMYITYKSDDVSWKSGIVFFFIRFVLSSLPLFAC